MGKTIRIKRDQTSGKPIEATDIVYSPDDGGYYAQWYDFPKNRSRVTEAIYPTASACEFAVSEGGNIWSAWD